MKQIQAEKSSENNEKKLDRLGSTLDVLAIASLAKDLNFLCRSIMDQKQISNVEALKRIATSVQISRYVPGNLEEFCRKNGLQSLQKYFQSMSKEMESFSDVGKLVSSFAKIYLTVSKGVSSYEDGVLILSSSQDFFRTANKILARNNLYNFNDAVDGAGFLVKNTVGKIVDFAAIGKAAYSFSEMGKAFKSVDLKRSPENAAEIFDAAAALGKIRITTKEAEANVKPKPLSASPLKEINKEALISSRL